MEQVTITKQRYDELLGDEKFLMALHAAGVDTWDGYSKAFEIMEEMED